MINQFFRAVFVSLAFAAVASAQLPVGGEFRVNTYTPSDQIYQRTAMEPDGDFVVVWQSSLQDGSFQGVFGQRFAASGLPRGGEFRINAYTTGTQHRPAVAVGVSGDFVVVWESYQDGSATSIHGRRFDGTGSAVGGEFQVNTFTTGYQYFPSVSRAADGRFVVSWTSIDGSDSGIAARRFDAAGNSIGSEFRVNTYTTGRQLFGDIAVGANGDFVAVWEDYNSNRDGSAAAIFGQRFDASGNALGSEFQVNTYTSGSQTGPWVSVSPAGGFVVVWDSSGDGSGLGVFGRIFDGSGNPQGNDFVVNTYTPGTQGGFLGQIAHDAGGNFVVTWSSAGQDGSSYGAFAQRFSASGARSGAEFQVNVYTTGLQARPSVASGAVGNFLIAWESVGQDGSGSGVFAHRYLSDLIFEDGFDPTPP